MTEMTLSLPVAVEPTLYKGVGFLPFKKLVAAGTMLLATSGCSLLDGEGDKPVFVKPERVSPSAAQINVGIKVSQFEEAILSDPVDVKGARAIAASFGGSLKATMDRTTDAAIADELLADQRGEYPRSNSASILSTITDPSLRRTADTAVYVIQAGKLVRKANQSQDFSLSAMKAEVNKDVPENAQATRAHATTALEAVYAQDIVNDYASSKDEEQKARARIDEIDDTAVHAFATVGVDVQDASKLLKDLYEGKITDTQAREDAANIEDLGTKKRTLAAIKAASYDPYRASDASDEFLGETAGVIKGIDELGDEFVVDELDGDVFYYGLEGVQLDGLEEIDILAGSHIARTQAIEPMKLKELPAIPNLSEGIDMSQVEGLQTIPNNCIEVAGPIDKEACDPRTYQQFGEIYAKDGKLVVEFQEGGGLTQKIRSQIESAVEYNRPFLEAGFAGGELVSVHLIVGKDFNFSYLTPTRESYLVFPKDNSMSVDHLRFGMAHEGFHALTRNFFYENGVSEERIRQLNSACNNLVKTAHEDFQTKLWTTPEILDNIREAAKDEHKAIIDTVIKAVKERTYARLATLNTAELQDAKQSTYHNQCLQVQLSSRDIVMNAIPESGVEASYGDLEYLFITDAFAELKKEWQEFVDYRSVFEKVINESNYVDTKSPIRPHLGHSQDNAAELAASILEAAIGYQEKFIDTVERLDPAERKAVLEALEFFLEELAKHPNIQEYVDQLQITYNKLKKQITP